MDHCFTTRFLAKLIKSRQHIRKGIVETQAGIDASSTRVTTAVRAQVTRPRHGRLPRSCAEFLQKQLLCFTKGHAGQVRTEWEVDGAIDEFPNGDGLVSTGFAETVQMLGAREWIGTTRVDRFFLLRPPAWCRE